MIRVGILGGGHIGLALAALLGAHEGCRVKLWGRSLPRVGHLRVSAWSAPVTSARLYARADIQVCAEPGDAVVATDVVVLTVPSHVRASLLRSLSTELNRCRLLLVWEGGGRLAETVDAQCLRSPTIVGLQRSPLLCRVTDAPQTHTNGGVARVQRTVRILGVRNTVVAATLCADETEYAQRLLRALLPFRLRFAADYACVRLSPGNPLIHPARLYACAANALRSGQCGLRFYADWDDAASWTLLALHAELAQLRDTLGLPATHLRTLVDSNRPWSPAALTRATRAAITLNAVRLPLRSAEQGGGWNTTHRFFAEDIGEGLATIVADALVAGVAMPTASAILRWYVELVGRSDASVSGNGKGASC